MFSFTNFSNLFKSRKSADLDWSSVKFPIIDPSARPMQRKRIPRTSTDLTKETTNNVDYSKNDYRVVFEETRNMKNEVVETYYYAYRVYSTGYMKRVCNQNELDWVLSRFNINR